MENGIVSTAAVPFTQYTIGFSRKKVGGLSVTIAAIRATSRHLEKLRLRDGDSGTRLMLDI